MSLQAAKPDFLLTDFPPEIMSIMFKALSFKDIAALRRTCSSFRGSFALVDAERWKEFGSLSFTRMQSLGLLTRASLHSVWGTCCPRNLKLNFSGEFNANGVFELNALSTKELKESKAYVSHVNGCLDVETTVNSIPKNNKCFFGSCLGAIKDNVHGLTVFAPFYDPDATLMQMNATFPIAEFASLRSVVADNVQKLFPAATTIALDSCEWPVPTNFVDPSLTLSVSNATNQNRKGPINIVCECLDVDTYELFLEKCTIDVKMLVLSLHIVDVGGADACPVITAEKVMFDGGVPAVQAKRNEHIAPFVRAKHVEILHNLGPTPLGGIVQLDGITQLHLCDLAVPLLWWRTQFPPNIEYLEVSNCLARSVPDVQMNWPETLTALKVVYGEKGPNSLRFDFSTPGLIGQSMKALHIELKNAQNWNRFNTVIDASGATKLSFVFLEGFTSGVTLIAPSEVPLTHLGVGKNTDCTLLPNLEPRSYKTCLQSAMVLTDLKLGPLMRSIYQRTNRKNFKSLDLTIRSKAAVQMLPTVLTISTQRFVEWFTALVLSQLHGPVKTLYKVVLSCLCRKQVSQHDVLEIDLNFSRVLSFLFPRSFQSTVYSRRIEVPHAQAAMCSRDPSLNGAPPTRTRLKISPEESIDASDKFIPIEEKTNEAGESVIVFRQLRLFTKDLDSVYDIVTAVKRLHDAGEISTETAHSMMQIVTTVPPHTVDSHSLLAPTSFITSDMAPVVITLSPLSQMTATRELDVSAVSHLYAGCTEQKVEELVRMYAGYAAHCLDLVVVTGQQALHEEWLQNTLELAPLRASSIVRKTVMLTERDARKANVQFLIQANACGCVKWVKVQSVKADASNDALINGFCTTLHNFSHVGLT